MEWEDVKHNKDIALFLKKIRGKGGGSMIKETIQAVEDAEAKASELVAQASEDARRVKAKGERSSCEAGRRTDSQRGGVRKTGTGRSRCGVSDAQRDGGQTETRGG